MLDLKVIEDFKLIDIKTLADFSKNVSKFQIENLNAIFKQVEKIVEQQKMEMV